MVGASERPYITEKNKHMLVNVCVKHVTVDAQVQQLLSGNAGHSCNMFQAGKQGFMHCLPGMAAGRSATPCFKSLCR
jgi:hypothetical protein